MIFWHLKSLIYKNLVLNSQSFIFISWTIKYFLPYDMSRLGVIFKMPCIKIKINTANFIWIDRFEVFWLLNKSVTDRQAAKQTNKQTHRQTDIQTDTPTDTQTNTQTDAQAYIFCLPACLYVCLSQTYIALTYSMDCLYYACLRPSFLWQLRLPENEPNIR